VKRYGGKSCFELFHEAEELFNPCSVAAQEGLVVRRPGSSNQREPPSRGLAVARARRSVAENAAEEGESSDNAGVPNDHNNGNNDINELQRGSRTNNVEEDGTSEDSSSEGDIDNAFQRPRTRQRQNSGIAVTSRVTRQRLSK
jgi:hypothetical protein